MRDARTRAEIVRREIARRELEIKRHRARGDAAMVKHCQQLQKGARGELAKLTRTARSPQP